MQLPKFLKPNYPHFGLAIGLSSLRAVEVDKRGKIIRQGEVIFDKLIFNEVGEFDKNNFIAGLKKLLDSTKFTTNYVAICFPEMYVYSRECELPDIKVTEVYESLKWKIGSLFPFPGEDLYYDWKLLNTFDHKKQVIVVAIQKQILDAILSSLDQLGLQVLRIEPGASAIAQLLALGKDQHAVLLEVNRMGSYITLVEGEKSLFTTVVSYIPNDTLNTYLERTKQTIEEILQYYKNKNIIKSEKTDVIVTGDGANNEWLQTASEKLGFAIKILKTPTTLAFHKAYAAAISPMVESSDPESINILPVNLQQNYTEQHLYYLLQKLSVVVATVSVICALVTLFVFTIFELQKKQIETESKRLNNIVKIKQADTQNLLLLNGRAKQVISLSSLKSTIHNQIAVLSRIIPEGIAIQGWEYDDTKLQFTVSGEAKSREQLLEFKEKLEQTEEFAKISLPLGSLESPVNARFSMTFTTKN